MFSQKIPLKNDLIGKIEHFGSMKHCKNFLFIPLLLTDNNNKKRTFVIRGINRISDIFFSLYIL